MGTKKWIQSKLVARVSELLMKMTPPMSQMMSKTLRHLWYLHPRAIMTLARPLALQTTMARILSKREMKRVLTQMKRQMRVVRQKKTKVLTTTLPTLREVVEVEMMEIGRKGKTKNKTMEVKARLLMMYPTHSVVLATPKNSGTRSLI